MRKETLNRPDAVAEQHRRFSETARELECVILDAVRITAPSSLRNYAMVLLIARLGLRPPEVAAMQIDDTNWRSGEILVRGKGDRQTGSARSGWEHFGKRGRRARAGAHRRSSLRRNGTCAASSAI